MSFIFSFYHWLWAVWGTMFYGNPSKNMTVIGITGTNGKSTVVDLTAKILEEAGCKVASISSLRIKIGEKEWKNELKMTMPGRAFLQKFLYKAEKEGVTHAVIEVTSEGIKQFRHKGIDFDVAAITNLTPEHIESHGGFENYRKAKEKLFASLSRSKKPRRIAIINGDDPSAKHFIKYDADEKWVYSKNPNYELSIADNVKLLKTGDYGLSERGIELKTNGEIIKSPLLGEFNVENILAATAISRSLNVGWDKIKKAVEKAKNIPGRLEFIDEGQNFKVVVDYAHTPDSLEKVYKTLNSVLKPERLICVLGSAGGGRDKWKRREMGKIANQYCRKTIITNEDPYDENPAAIIDEVATGFSQITNYEKILDRKEAIKEAIENAETGDIVIITGKGAELWIMGSNGLKIPWDDREIARDILKEKK